MHCNKNAKIGGRFLKVKYSKMLALQGCEIINNLDGNKSRINF